MLSGGYLKSEGRLSFDFLGRNFWRRGSGSNRRIKVLQTSPLPLGYRASCHLIRLKRGLMGIHACLNCMESVSQMRFVWSGRPGSNRLHLPWQGSTLPLSYSRSYFPKYNGCSACGQRGARTMRRRAQTYLAGACLAEIDAVPTVAQV